MEKGFVRGTSLAAYPTASPGSTSGEWRRSFEPPRHSSTLQRIPHCAGPQSIAPGRLPSAPRDDVVVVGSRSALRSQIASNPAASGRNSLGSRPTRGNRGHFPGTLGSRGRRGPRRRAGKPMPGDPAHGPPPRPGPWRVGRDGGLQPRLQRAVHSSKKPSPGLAYFRASSSSSSQPKPDAPVIGIVPSSMTGRSPSGNRTRSFQNGTSLP